jgi:hypothetical protein
MRPNFLIVGAEKAGTTSLASMLAQHPDVFISCPKELRFFSHHNWGRGMSWYESFFSQATSFSARGEASPAYTWAPQSINVPERIYRCLGDILYIYIVRDPIERTISHYRHAIFHRWIPDDADLVQAIHSVPGIMYCSKYNFQYLQYQQTTRPDQWQIVIFEDMINSQLEQIEILSNFLHVSKYPDIALPRENVSDTKVRLPRIFRDFLRSSIADSHQSLARVVYNMGLIFAKPVPKPELDHEEITYLIREFREDTRQLSIAFEYDFNSKWGIT